MRKIISITALILIHSELFSQKEIPFTLEDRDRITRIETLLKEFKENTEKRFEQIEKRFEQIIYLLIGIVGAFAGIVAVTIGFAIWDRRTALQPYLKKSKDIEEKEEIILKILKEYSNKNPELAEILRNYHII